MTPIYKTAAGERLVRERYGETFVVACVHISQLATLTDTTVALIQGTVRS